MASDLAVSTWDSLMRVGARMRKYLGGHGRTGGLHGPQFHALVIVVEAGEQGIRLGDIGSKLFVTGSNVTGLVDRLEQGGYATRETDPNDRRVLLARATPEGRALYEAVAPGDRAKVIHVLSCLSDDEKAILSELLDRVAASVQRALDEPTSREQGDPT
jgi:MarR family transcriptional regulator, 2-MHQ and catechol-resistance regulon repressor